MLRPGGVLRLWDVVYSFEPADARHGSKRGARPVATTSRAAGCRAELEEHVRDEHSTFSWLLEPMIERSGFEIEQAEHSADGMFAKYVLRAA